MSKAKVAPPTVIQGKVLLTRVAAWCSASGLPAMVYDEPLEGSFQVITKRHLYHWMAGRDLYPTPEQFDALTQGQQVRFGLSQWA